MIRGQFSVDNLENVNFLHQPLKLISSGFGHVLILSESNQLYSFGRNDCMQLGFESENPDEVDVLKITQIPWDSTERGHIKSIHCGSLHSLIFTDNNNIYSCGSNSFGQCSIPSNQSTMMDEYISRFTRVETLDQTLLNNIETIVCKFAHSSFITSDGELYCCGRNHDGELGILNTELVNKFTKVENIPAIKLVDFAWKYIVFITENNEIFSSRNGILRTEPTENPCIGKYNGWNPSVIANNEIIKVQCGNEHTIILTAGMELFGFGYSPNGELGLGRNHHNKIVKEIVRIGGSIQRLDRICDFFTSYNQLIVFTTSGSLYVSGLNNRGQLNFATPTTTTEIATSTNTNTTENSIMELTRVFHSKFFNSACIGNQFTLLFHQLDGQSKSEKKFKQQLFHLLVVESSFQDVIVL